MPPAGAAPTGPAGAPRGALHRGPTSGQRRRAPPPGSPRHPPPGVGRGHRREAQAPSTASRGPSAPLHVSGHAHVAGHSGTASGPWCAPPSGPWPAPCPPRPPPYGSVLDASRCSVASSGLWRGPTPGLRASRPGPCRVHRADLTAMGQARDRASRVPPTLLPCLPGVSDPAGSVSPSPARCLRCGLPRVRSASAPRTSPIAGRHTLPARSPVTASRLPLPVATHDSGPVWVAHPALSGTFTLSHPAGLSRHTPTAGEPRPEARAQRRLLSVACMPWFK